MATEPGAITIGASQLRLLLAYDVAAASSLRALVHELDESPVGLEFGHESLAEHVAWLITRGRIHVELELRTPTASDVMRTHYVTPQQLRPFEPSELDEGGHWIEIEVIGPGAAVVSGLRCEITLPTGRKLMRSTDRYGMIRVDGIEHAGECTIRFPEFELDESA